MNIWKCVYKWYYEHIKFYIPFWFKHIIPLIIFVEISILLLICLHQSESEFFKIIAYDIYVSIAIAILAKWIDVLPSIVNIDYSWNRYKGGKHYALHRFFTTNDEKFCEWMKNYRDKMLIQNPNANLKTFDSVVGFNSESVINAWDADEFLKIYKDEEVIDLLNLYDIADDIKKGQGGFDELAVNVAKMNFGLEIYQLEGCAFEGDENGNEINIEYYYKFRKKTPLNN